jgi:hypothetical protein
VTAQRADAQSVLPDATPPRTRREEQELAALPGVVVLDAQKPRGELALEALRAVAAGR